MCSSDLVQGEGLECHLSSDGVLQIMAPIDWNIVNLNQHNNDSVTEYLTNDDNSTAPKFCEVCHNEWSKMRRSDEYFRVLPTYERIPFWEQRFICISEQSRRQLGIHSDHENYKVSSDFCF